MRWRLYWRLAFWLVVTNSLALSFGAEVQELNIKELRRFGFRSILSTLSEEGGEVSCGKCLSTRPRYNTPDFESHDCALENLMDSDKGDNALLHTVGAWKIVARTN